jgi:aryl-phospho-beta-D-glucosidase BglC (GH1 family)
MITAAGLNWVRIPLPFWAIETYPNEPHLPKVSWKYFLTAIEWARKYGLRINLDLHAIPGSQNGWNHSGKMGQIDFLNGVMGLTNAQRALDYIRIIAEFISQPEYRNVVPFFGIMNEPNCNDSSFPLSAIQAFYAKAYTIIRNVGGTGAGNGPFISIHEAFQGLDMWTDFLTGADRLALDSHPYICFNTLSPGPIESFIPLPCSTWGSLFGDSMSAFGLTAAGEWSNAINDCGLYLNGVGSGTRYEGTYMSTDRIGSCDSWNDYQSWDQTTKDALKQFSLSTMDALQNWFFWTWKIGESSATGQVEAPLWSYKLAIQEGWAVTDPRQSRGQCTSLGVTGNTFTGNLTSWQVGGAGAGQIPTLDSYVWPPTSIGGYTGAARVAELPLYTATGAISTLPVPIFIDPGTASTINVGDGWANPADQTMMAVPLSGCIYPDNWNALSTTIPACATLHAKRTAAPAPGPTPMV